MTRRGHDVLGRVDEIGTRGAWVIWAVAMAVYVLAVFFRSSMGVAGLLAVDRFDISATQLAFFTILQLLVYATMQVPVGVLLDRFGSKVLVLCGLVLMTAGQLAFAFTTSFPAAVAARAVVGAGDAMIFVSVIRLVTVWFLVRQAPTVVQLTGQLGQLGALLAAGPLAWLLHELGWTQAFALTSTVGVVLLVVAVLVIDASPYPSGGPVRVKLGALARSVRTVWGNPGTRLGMWSHFTSQFSMTVFALLWGFPFLVRGEGLSTGAAATLMMVMTGSTLVCGLVLGRLVSRIPYHRSHLVLGIVGLIALTWTAVLALPDPAPTWLLVVLVCVMGAGGPASLVGFDLARSFMPVEASGRANGIVNIGGFVAALVTMFLIGRILDLRGASSGSGYSLDDFRVAMCAQYLVWGLGAVQILRYRHKALAHLRRVHPGAVETLQRGEPFVHPGFSDREGVLSLSRARSPAPRGAATPRAGAPCRSTSATGSPSSRRRRCHALAGDLEDNGGQVLLAVDRPQGHGGDPALVEQPAQRHLGRLDREPERRTATQVLQVEQSGGVGVGEGRDPVDREPSVVEPVGQHDRVRREAVTADVRDLPGLLGGDLGQRGRERPATLGAAGVVAPVRAHQVRRLVDPVEPGGPALGQAGEVEVDDVLLAVENRRLEPRPRRVRHQHPHPAAGGSPSPPARAGVRAGPWRARTRCLAGRT